MKKSNILEVVLISILLFINLSCASSVEKGLYPGSSTGKYDNEFPYSGKASQLRELGNSIRLIVSMVYYETYYFAYENKLTTGNLTDEVIKYKSLRMENTSQSNSGTATIIYSNDGKIALLTSAHIVDPLDTLISYYPAELNTTERYIESVSIKLKQSIYVAEIPEAGELDILTSNRASDIAVIGKYLKKEYQIKFQEFEYKLGHTDNLEWGSLVYVLGYPINNKMITRGIVSLSSRTSNDIFMVDAVINKGFSGGIVMAVKGGMPNFELVGIVQTAPAEREYILKPEPPKPNTEYNPRIPYTGQLFADKLIKINYGITKVIAIERIINYLSSKQDLLRSKGYDLSAFLKRQ